MSGRYNLVKEFIVKPIKKALKEKSSGKAIKKIEPNVPKTRLEKAESRLKIQQHKTKMAGAKLDQTNFEIQNPKFSKGKYTYDPDKRNVTKKSKLREKKMGGGMMGRRMGYKDGSKKSDFGAQSVKYGLDKNYGVTKADRIAKFVGKKNKKKII